MITFGQKFWQEQTIDYLLIVGEVNRFWVTKFESSYGYILVSKDNLETKVFLDARYFHEGQQVIKNAQVLPIDQFFPLWKKLVGTVGFESNLPYQNYHFFRVNNPNIKLKPVDFQQLRIVKNAWEITQIRTVCQKTVQVWQKTQQQLKNFSNEKQLEAFLLQTPLKLGITERSFFPIVSSGLSSALIHTKAKNQPIKQSVLCDFGLKLNGYCSDFTRSVVFANDRLALYYRTIMHIQKAIIAKIKPGLKIGQLAQFAHELYQKHGLRLDHAIGHGIGLEVHEAPMIVPSNKEVLVPGMVFTVEPGVYLPKLGGVRIEDVVLVTEQGCEVLTKM